MFIIEKGNGTNNVCVRACVLIKKTQMCFYESFPPLTSHSPIHNEFFHNVKKIFAEIFMYTIPNNSKIFAEIFAVEWCKVVPAAFHPAAK